MKVSALICSLWVDKNKPQVLYKCINSLKGADEVLSLVTEPSTRLGFADSWNRLAGIATGDYLIFIGDSNVLIKGNLKDLCIPDTVTFPIVNGFFSAVIFCMPRNIYEQIGLYDISFNNGVHYEDLDFWRTVLKNEIKYKAIDNVVFYKFIEGRSINKIKNMNNLEELNKSVYIKKWGDTNAPDLKTPKFSNHRLVYSIVKIRNIVFGYQAILKKTYFNLTKFKSKK